MAENNDIPDKKLEPREYQQELLEAAKKQNIIVCLGTGTGKTFISIKFIEYLARKDDIMRPFSEGAKRSFFLVDSVPLVNQQACAIRENTALNVAEFCGEMDVDSWEKDTWLNKFEDNHVLVMTCQIYLNLIQHAQHGFSLSQANLLVFDECHHAKKKHSFKKIMDCFGDVHNQRDLPRILGLTASVVGEKVKPLQVCDKIKKLECTMRSVCKTASDPDVVEKYGAKPEEIMETYPSSNELDYVAMQLENKFCSVLDPLQKFLCDVKVPKDERGSEDVIKKELNIAKRAVRDCLSALDEIGVWAAYQVSMMLVDDLEKRVKKVSSGLSSHAKIASLLIETTITSLQEIAWKYNKFGIANRDGIEKIQHDYLKPKVKKLLKLFMQRKDDQSDILAIVFVQRRNAACVLSKLINTLASTSKEYNHLKSDFVTGHGSELLAETEMDFRKQNKKLKNFRLQKFNVLVGTSVVEEGVDIPKCNLVVMFDFPKNFQEFVQSRGRGRAKGAKYVMLVPENALDEYKQRLQMAQDVDEEIRRICQTERDGPTEEEINKAINVYPLSNFYTEKNAKLDMGNCVACLFRYCSKLACDRFTSLKPLFTTYDVDGEFQCTLKMPGNSQITRIIQGETMPNKKEAREAVAFKACIMLHEHGALDDHLLPVESSSESESDHDDKVDGSLQPKTGTKKRRRSHRVKVSNQLYGKLTTDGTKKLYVYAINMTFDEVYNQEKKQLWDRKAVSLGIVTREKLPIELPPLSLYNDIGKLTVSLELCDSVDILTSTQQRLVNWFHRFIFTKTLKFKVGGFTKNGCRVVLLNDNDTGVTSSTQTVGINFKEMEVLKKNVSKHDGTFSTNIDFSDSVVVEGYLRSVKHSDPGHYLVITTNSDVTESEVKAIHHTRNIDCRRSKDFVFGLSTENKSKSRIIQRNPHTLEYRSSPMSLTLRALFLPAILYRVDSLVSMDELRHSVSIEDSFPYVVTPESPAKKARICSSQVYIPEVPSTLLEYFSPLYSSKIVPLFKLLEAVTCKSSADDFNLERLETLGDSFLKMAVSIHVYWHKNHKDEGKLTKYRKRQISNKNLYKLAENRDLARYIKYSTFDKGTWLPPGFSPLRVRIGDLPHLSDDETDVIDVCVDDVITQTIPDKGVADSMEALIGAYFLHCGYLGALRFMRWLGVGVFFDENTESDEFTEGNRRKSPTPHYPSKYADYPLPTIEVPPDEEKTRYEDILVRQTKEMASFEKKIKYTFKNKVLLLEAFTHPTFNENTITGSYQRLEFLGDAILDFLVTQHIYHNCEKDLKPGELTDLRSALVNNNIFAVIAIENNYHKYLKEYSPVLFNAIRKFVQGVEEFHEDHRTTVIPDPYTIPVPSDSTADVECIEAPKPLGDVFESVAGAIFLDSGLDVNEVWRVYHPMLEKYINEYSKTIPRNAKKIVQEQDAKSEFSPVTRLDNGRVSCTLTFNGQEFEGVGRNKHNAKLSASYKALKMMRKSG